MATQTITWQEVLGQKAYTHVHVNAEIVSSLLYIKYMCMQNVMQFSSPVFCFFDYVYDVACTVPAQDGGPQEQFSKMAM